MVVSYVLTITHGKVFSVHGPSIPHGALVAGSYIFGLGYSVA
jgi:hypothetical protein